MNTINVVGIKMVDYLVVLLRLLIGKSLTLRYMNTINVVGIKMVDYFVVLLRLLSGQVTHALIYKHNQCCWNKDGGLFSGFIEIIDWISHTCSAI